MSRKPKVPTFEQILDALRARSFVVFALTGGQFRISKYGCGAVLAAGKTGTVAEVETARFTIGGELATLVDRGYQKFLKTSKFEAVATAEALHAIHQFSEELKQVTGEISLFNQGLGTTSDEYLYDRLKGREPGRADAPGELGTKAFSQLL
jgi:hypothetical protein